jgi:hypothetical protein
MVAQIMEGRESPTMDSAVTAQIADIQAANATIRELNDKLRNIGLTEEEQIKLDGLLVSQQTEMMLLQTMVSDQTAATELLSTMVSTVHKLQLDPAATQNLR